MSKRPGECLFCTSRRCSSRIVAHDKSYDEVACLSHSRDLGRDADRRAPGVIKSHISSTGHLRRGEPDDTVRLLEELMAGERGAEKV